MTKILLFLALSFTSLYIASCGSSAPSNFYLLHARGEGMTGPGQTLNRPIIIGIGPLEIPEYLDRPQIVTRTSANTIMIHEFERWAEPIKDGIIRVLTENLSGKLEKRSIVVYPWGGPFRADFRLGLNITRFDADPDGRIILAGWWSLYDTANRKISKKQSFFLSQQPENHKIASMVDKQSDLLTQLSEKIAHYLSLETVLLE